MMIMINNDDSNINENDDDNDSNIYENDDDNGSNITEMITRMIVIMIMIKSTVMII